MSDEASDLGITVMLKWQSLMNDFHHYLLLLLLFFSNALFRAQMFRVKHEIWINWPKVTLDIL